MTPGRVFLTGEPGCGKTTVIRKTSDILVGLGKRPGGMISGEIRRDGVRIGFSLEDLMTHDAGILARVDQREGPSVGKYRVNLLDIERVGVMAIRRAVAQADVVIVDELGPMELHSTAFIAAVEMAQAASNAFLATIHKRASHPLISSIRSDPTNQILEVTLNNRELLPSKIVELLTGHA
jgi:nucleoside-triphosphatase